MTTRKDKALGILSKYYGYDSFRPGQYEMIDAALSGQDTLVLMPTGGGKSLCYQIPALMCEGCAIVISPLIALMDDQVNSLRANGIAARAIHTNQSDALNYEAYRDAATGKLKLLYISPERLLMDLDVLARSVKVSLIAIDEAHCISQWGHDFRPVYKQLVTLRNCWSEVPVMALTATADRLTRLDIEESLGLRNPIRHIGSFDRPNLSLTVLPDPGKAKRLDTIVGLVRKYSQDCGIVYCISRKKTEAMYEGLRDRGIRAVCYHAGMPAAMRSEAQRAFVNGEVQVICATIAFGMGIDKSNIRWIVHNNLPGNIESYYQEIGRAGRDGLPAETLMFYNYGDVMTRRSFADESGQHEVNSEKLDQMQRYAEASVCRRRILLSYFSEESDHDCGNCDNCRNPRPKFDGTVLAQKALSAVIRTGSREGIGMIIDLLRGSRRNEILAKGYHRLPTYGVGNDLDSRQWHSYLLQMLQLGLLEIAYEDNFHLRPTPLGLKVVRGESRIELSRYSDVIYGKRNRSGSVTSTPKAVPLTPDELLLKKLKETRSRLAARSHIADYIIMSDVSLERMVTQKPVTLVALSRIEGVSLARLAKYGKIFVELMIRQTGSQVKIPSSQDLTLYLFEQGADIESIADMRDLAESTVAGHISDALVSGYNVDADRIAEPGERAKIAEVFSTDYENRFEILKDKYGIPSWRVRLVAQLGAN